MSLRWSKRNKALIVGICILLSVCGVVYRLAMPGTLFLLRFMDSDLEAGESFEVFETVIDRSMRKMPVRVYKPANVYDSVLLVLHGVHFSGYDEVRLVHFSKILAGFGYAVVTPDIEDLKTYEISERAVQDIESTFIWMLDKSGLMEASSDENIGILGISFSGGLGLSAASSPELRNRTKFVFSFGGHGDLKRTMVYLATGDQPEAKLPPHVYGQAVLVRQFASQLVPEADVEPLRLILLQYLKGEIKEVKNSLDNIGADGKRLVQLCLKRNTKELGSILEPIVRAYSPKAILSPINGEPPPCPVFLLHGSVDNVIPPFETHALHRWASKSTKTTALISDLIKHVELEEKEGDSTSTLSYWEIIRFWTELLRS